MEVEELVGCILADSAYKQIRSEEAEEWSEDVA